jgi:hypothetical protein
MDRLARNLDDLRRIVVILHRMLRDSSEFRWSAKEVHAA